MSVDGWGGGEREREIKTLENGASLTQHLAPFVQPLRDSQQLLTELKQHQCLWNQTNIVYWGMD